MSSAIRDVVIKIAIEQKTAALAAPDFSAWRAAALQAGKDDAAAYASAFGSMQPPSISAVQSSSGATSGGSSLDEGIAETQRMIDALNAQLDAQEQVGDATVSVQQEMTTAIQQTSQAQQSATTNEISSAKQVAASRSAVIAAYGQSTAAALQMAKGIAFVVASSEEEAQAMVRAVAAAQGYFDLATGGIHALHALNDIQRQSAILLQAEAVAAGLSASANTAAAASGVSLAASETAIAAASVPAAGGLSAVAAAAWMATAPLLPFVAIAAAAAAAAYGVWTALTAMNAVENKGLQYQSDYLNKLTQAATSSAAALSRSAQASLQMSSFRQKQNVEDNDTDAMKDELQKLEQTQKQIAAKRAQLAKEGDRREIEIAGRKGPQSSTAANIAGRIGAYASFGMAGGTDANRAAAQTEQLAKRELDYQKEVAANAANQKALAADEVALQEKKLDIEKAIQGSMQAQFASAESNRNAAAQTLATEIARNQSENVRLGLMSRSDQTRAKRLLDKVAGGGELTIREARRASSLGIAQGSVEKTALSEANKRGLTGAREATGETRPLKAAEENNKLAKTAYDSVINEISKELSEGKERTKAGFERLGKAMEGLADFSDELAKLSEKIERLEKGFQKGTR